MLGVNARAIQNFNINIGTRFAHFHCVDFDETRAIDEHLISTIILKEQSEFSKNLPNFLIWMNLSEMSWSSVSNRELVFL